MRLLVCLLTLLSFFSCKNKKNIPDVSDIKISLATTHFEKELFSLDTNKISFQFDSLISKQRDFGEIFLNNIINADPQWDSETTAAYVKDFISAYRSIYDTCEIVFSDFSPYEKEIKYGLQFLKYYFPDYKAPGKIITYLGPIDGYGDILAENVFIIGLHQHLGREYSLYKSLKFQETYPRYISQRFEPDYISINCMKNIVLDMYPEKNDESSLIDKMIEKGKRLYVLGLLLPHYDEHKLIGYTEKQLKNCYKHEANIWSLFVQNNLLQMTDYNMQKNYISEGPKTQELGEDSPGNIGSFVGWQIVKKYMANHSELTPAVLMKTDSETIFQEVKYKP